MLKEFFNVSGYPALSNNAPFQSKLVLLLQVYGIIFLLNLLTAPITYFTDLFVTHVLHFNSLTRQYQHSMLRVFEKFGYLKALLYICVIGPIIEECIFRLPLSLKKQHVALALGFALLFAVRLVPAIQQQNLLINLLVRAAIFAAGYLIFKRILPEFNAPVKKLQKRVIVISMLVFGLMHIFNYVPLHWSIIFIYPLFVVPQLLMGWFLTYIRFKNGFFWGIALHMLVNSVSMLIYSIYSHRV